MIDPRVVEALVTARARPQSPLDFLTPRESEVLAEMALGRNNAGIGAALGLSERAVEKHINSLFAKLGVTSEPDVHRRVKAVLLHLSERSMTAAGGTTPSGCRVRTVPMSDAATRRCAGCPPCPC